MLSVFFFALSGEYRFVNFYVEPELCSRNQEGSFELINSCPDFVHPRAFTSGQ